MPEEDGIETFYVVGWFDGSPECIFCINFAHAMTEYERIKAKRPKAINWFLELNMVMRYNFINSKGVYTYEFRNEINIKKEGTYYDIYDKFEKELDIKIRIVGG